MRKLLMKLAAVRKLRIEYLEDELKQVKRDMQHYRTLYLNRKAWEESQRRIQKGAD